jgi:hypothetical protein
MTCPECGNTVDPHGADTATCVYCLTPLAVVGGEIVPDVTTEYEHIEVMEVTL